MAQATEKAELKLVSMEKTGLLFLMLIGMMQKFVLFVPHWDLLD